jgi:hypothetical protein
MSKFRVSINLGLLLIICALEVGCSNVPIPPILGSAPTPTLPKASATATPKVAVAVETPTSVLASGDQDEVQQAMNAFLQAVSAGKVDEAMTYWSLYQPGQPSDYATNMRKIVTGWANGNHQFAVGTITYSGLVAPGDYRTMPRDDPRVSHATVNVRIDGSDYTFSLIQAKSGWLIEGIAASNLPLATATPH